MEEERDTKSLINALGSDKDADIRADAATVKAIGVIFDYGAALRQLLLSLHTSLRHLAPRYLCYKYDLLRVLRALCKVSATRRI